MPLFWILFQNDERPLCMVVVWAPCDGWPKCMQGADTEQPGFQKPKRERKSQEGRIKTYTFKSYIILFGEIKDKPKCGVTWHLNITTPRTTQYPGRKIHLTSFSTAKVTSFLNSLQVRSMCLSVPWEKICKAAQETWILKQNKSLTKGSSSTEWRKAGQEHQPEFCGMEVLKERAGC